MTCIMLIWQEEHHAFSLESLARELVEWPLKVKRGRLGRCKLMTVWQLAAWRVRA